MLHAATFLFMPLAVIDLSQPFAQSENHNANPGASVLLNAQRSDVLGFAVVKAGQLVASSAASERQNVWSVTKTWVATAIGILVQNNILNVSTTLEAALPDVNWNAVSAANAKRAITIEQMLSMSSGLTAPCLAYGPQGTVEQALNSPQFTASQVGRQNYLCSGSILSYVIYQQTGRTPLQYASEHLFPSLGISRSVAWSPAHGSNSINEAGHGLVLAPFELAKLGSLYRQGGVTGGASSTQLIPSSFVAASSVDQLAQRIPASYFSYLGMRCTFKSNGAGYGYMKWIFTTASGPADCAQGRAGQFICTFPDLDVIIAITSRGTTDYSSSCELLDLVASGLDFDSSSAPGIIGIVVGGVAAVVTLAAVIILALWLSRTGCFKSNNKVEGPRAAAEEAAAQAPARARGFAQQAIMDEGTLAQLKALAELKAAGVLTDEEAEEEKATILAAAKAATSASSQC